MKGRARNAGGRPRGAPLCGAAGREKGACARSGPFLRGGREVAGRGGPAAGDKSRQTRDGDPPGALGGETPEDPPPVGAGGLPRRGSSGPRRPRRCSSFNGCSAWAGPASRLPAGSSRRGAAAAAPVGGGGGRGRGGGGAGRARRSPPLGSGSPPRPPVEGPGARGGLPRSRCPPRGSGPGGGGGGPREGAPASRRGRPPRADAARRGPVRQPSPPPGPAPGPRPPTPLSRRPRPRAPARRPR